MSLGLGVGMIFGEAVAGIMVGMGLGFIAGTLFKIEPGLVILRIPPVTTGIIMELLEIIFII